MSYLPWILVILHHLHPLPQQADILAANILGSCLALHNIILATNMFNCNNSANYTPSIPPIPQKITKCWFLTKIQKSEFLVDFFAFFNKKFIPRQQHIRQLHNQLFGLFGARLELGGHIILQIKRHLLEMVPNIIKVPRKRADDVLHLEVSSLG